MRNEWICSKTKVTDVIGNVVLLQWNTDIQQMLSWLGKQGRGRPRSRIDNNKIYAELGFLRTAPYQKQLKGRTTSKNRFLQRDKRRRSSLM